MKKEDVDVGVAATGFQKVGRYGIQIEWSDGHDTGFFDFRFLRAIDDDAARDGSS